jgi:hypothetical protein
LHFLEANGVWGCGDPEGSERNEGGRKGGRRGDEGERGGGRESEHSCICAQVCTLRDCTGRVLGAAAKWLSEQHWKKVCMYVSINR